MTYALSWAAVSAASLAGLVVVTVGTLKGWRDWIALRRLDHDRPRRGEGATPPGPAVRIELADLRERVRKLEAIAAGVEL